MNTPKRRPTLRDSGQNAGIPGGNRCLLLAICAAVFLLGLQARLSAFDSARTPSSPNTFAKLALDGETPKLHAMICPVIVWLAALWFAAPLAECRAWPAARPQRAHPPHPALIAFERFLRPPPRLFFLPC